MQPTLKRYETHPDCRRFAARVAACRPDGNAWQAALDETAFYPEGGGQPCDTGTLGGAVVTDVQLRDGVIWHTVTAPLAEGARVEGEIDWARRLDHMEQHTGEHILSGTLHRLFGAENVGFHIGSPAVRMDMSLPLTADQLAEAERLANEAVRADAPVRAWYPDPDELAGLTYRSKKELDGPVRLVDAGGADLCACCGTHLARTGQVGLIKILSAQHYKGGTRLAVVCGGRAQAAVAGAWADAEAAGALLSAGPGRLAEAARHALDATAAARQRLAALQNTLAGALAASAQPGQPFVAWCDGADADGLRRLCLAVAGRTGALCALLGPGGRGTAYALTLPGQDARPLARELNAAFDGRGGGKPELCQGSLAAPIDKDAAAAFFRRWAADHAEPTS